MSLSAVLLASVLAVSDISDYERSDCSDPDALEKWAEVLDRQIGNPSEHVFVRLYALRTGLCAMLKAGLIRYDQAVDIFDDEHIRSIDELMQRAEEDLERQHEEGLIGEGGVF